MDSWKPGDLAICVDTDPILLSSTGLYSLGGKKLVKERLYRVVRSTIRPNTAAPHDLHLQFEEPIGWKLAMRFKRVKPDLDASENDEVLVAKIKGRTSV